MHPPGFLVSVLGPLGVLRDAVVRILATDGLTATTGPDPPSVVVLVDPSAADWEAAKATGASVVLLTSHSLHESAVLEAVLRGADAVLHGDATAERMVRCVRSVAGGATELSPDEVRALADLLRQWEASGQSTVPRLTRRELEIVASIDRGESVKQTARVIGISSKTVENLQTRLFRKLGVRNRAQAIMRAHALGLVPPAEHAQSA